MVSLMIRQWISIKSMPLSSINLNIYFAEARACVDPVRMRESMRTRAQKPVRMRRNEFEFLSTHTREFSNFQTWIQIKIQIQERSADSRIIFWFLKVSTYQTTQ